MHMDPKINVVLTAYNHEKYIIQCIESIYDQSYKNINSVVVVDDFSTDATLDKLKALKYGNLHIHSNPRNLGVSSSANIALSRGIDPDVPYIALTSGDDAWEPHKIESQLSHLETHTDCGLVFTDSVCLDANHNKQPRLDVFDVTNRTRHDWMRRLFVGNCLLAPSVVMRRSTCQTVGQFSPILRQLQDWDLWIRTLCSGFEWHVIPDPLTLYRHIDSSISNTSSPMRASREIFEGPLCLKSFTQMSLADFRAALSPFIRDSQMFADTQSVEVGLAEVAARINTPIHRRFAAETMCNYYSRQGSRIISDSSYHDFIGALNLN
jgi:glycosyltransferase involved in cell wall biosynthesis